MGDLDTVHERTVLASEQFQIPSIVEDRNVNFSPALAASFRFTGIRHNLGHFEGQIRFGRYCPGAMDTHDRDKHYNDFHQLFPLCD